MGATETVDLFFELINDDRREKAVELFAENAVLGISVPGSDERTNLRGRDKVGGWFIRAGDGFRMFTNDSRNMGASYVADVTVIRPGVQPMQVEANFRVENGEIVSALPPAELTRSHASRLTRGRCWVTDGCHHPGRARPGGRRDRRRGHLHPRVAT